MSVVLAGPGVCPTASAAVRLCTDLVVAAAAAADETAAKTEALRLWKKEAERAGAGFVRWENAAYRALTCEPPDKGLFRCTARGRPCTIKQVAPPGTEPLPRQPRPSIPRPFKPDSEI